MPLILGLDPSIRKAGYCVVDTDAAAFTFVEKGRLKTSVSDGILIQRLIKQRAQFRELFSRYSIDFVSMEAPYLGDNESEHLFALNQFLHEVFYERGTYVITFPPKQLKHLAVPEKPVDEVGKARMIARAKELYGLMGKGLTDDEADAMHAARLGYLFYNWHFEKKVTDEELDPLIYHAFKGKRIFQRGAKKGLEEYKGLIYRENELFFDFKKIKERQERKNNGREKS